MTKSYYRMMKSNKMKSDKKKSEHDMKFDKANWDDEKLFKRYIDLCMEEVNAKNTSGGSLKIESWEKIRNVIKVEFELNLAQKQLKNKWDYLKKKTQIWTKLVGITGNTHYDPFTNTINWSTEQWDEYIQVLVLFSITLFIN